MPNATLTLKILEIVYSFNFLNFQPTKEKRKKKYLKFEK